MLLNSNFDELHVIFTLFFFQGSAAVRGPFSGCSLERQLCHYTLGESPCQQDFCVFPLPIFASFAVEKAILPPRFTSPPFSEVPAFRCPRQVPQTYCSAVARGFSRSPGHFVARGFSRSPGYFIARRLSVRCTYGKARLFVREHFHRPHIINNIDRYSADCYRAVRAALDRAH